MNAMRAPEVMKLSNQMETRWDKSPTLEHRLHSRLHQKGESQARCLRGFCLSTRPTVRQSCTRVYDRKVHVSGDPGCGDWTKVARRWSETGKRRSSSSGVSPSWAAGTGTGRHVDCNSCMETNGRSGPCAWHTADKIAVGGRSPAETVMHPPCRCERVLVDLNSQVTAILLLFVHWRWECEGMALLKSFTGPYWAWSFMQ